MREDSRTSMATQLQQQAERLTQRSKSLGPGEERLRNRIDKQADAMRDAAARHRQ